MFHTELRRRGTNGVKPRVARYPSGIFSLDVIRAADKLIKAIESSRSSGRGWVGTARRDSEHNQARTTMGQHWEDRDDRTVRRLQAFQEQPSTEEWNLTTVAGLVGSGIVLAVQIFPAVLWALSR